MLTAALCCLIILLKSPVSAHGDFRRAEAADQQQYLSQDSSEAHLRNILQDYLSNAQLEEHLRNFTARCGISKVFSIGKSALGVELWGLEISNHPGVEEPKPRFKYVGNMHGDEPTGRVLQLAFAEWLCAHWKTDARAKMLVEDMKLYLLPTMNPDGFSAKKRGNSATVDLNRDFPDPLELGFNNLEATGKEQPETLAVMSWSKSMHFVAGASMHEGAFVANYPWDGSEDRGTHYSASPDDAAFVHLAQTYASVHGKMNVSREFPGGITNGAAWYPLWGGMQDWNYLAAGCMELTLELSQNKWPPASELPSIWEDNKLSMAALPLVAAFGGLRGFVRVAEVSHHLRRKHKGLLEASKPPSELLPATISVEGIDFNVSLSSSFGDYYRPLAPGKYVVTASAPGFQPHSAMVLIPMDGSGRVHNFVLEPLESPGQGVSNGHKKTSHHVSGLPRKFGAFDREEGRSLTVQPNFSEEEELLMSESVWMKMMQTAFIFFLGCSVGLLGVSALIGLRLLTLERLSGFPAPLLPARLRSFLRR